MTKPSIYIPISFKQHNNLKISILCKLALKFCISKYHRETVKW